jgi:hypothetical protein
MAKQHPPNRVLVDGVGRAEYRTGSTEIRGVENLADDIAAARSEKIVLESRKQSVCFKPAAAQKHECKVEFDGKFNRCPLGVGERCRY